MAREYTFIHPDIDPARATAAVAEILSSDEALPRVAFIPAAGGPIERLAHEFAVLVQEGLDPSNPILARFAQQRGWTALPLHVGCFANATGALFAALSAAGVAGGEVITASLNFVGVPNAIVLAGARPRFVDVDPKSWCMDAASTERALGKKTRAILLTHVNRAVDVEPFAEMLSRRGQDIPIIQDASVAMGSTCGGIHPGLLNVGPGGATVASLATSKVLSGLGGALLATNDAELVGRTMSIAYQGISLTEADRLTAHGANIKMNELNAAIALEQFGRRRELFERRRQLKALYDEHLAPLVADGSVVLQDVGEEAVVTHYAVLLRDRNAVAQRLMEKHRVAIGLWHILHLQGLYQGCAAGALPVAESLAGRIAFLPFHTRLADEDVAFICRALCATQATAAISASRG